MLALPKRINTLITYADNVVTRMTGNAYFPSPSPALAAVSAAITDLQHAETATLARTKGAAATRNAKRAILVSLLQGLRQYVQSIVDGNEENAPAMIQSSGLAVKKAPNRKPRVFAALAGANSGTVLQFRYRWATKTGASDWSAPVTYTVKY